MSEMRKIQFDLPDQRAKELDELATEAGVTRKDLFNNALTLLEWAIDQKHKGRIIASLDEANQSYRELMMPIFNKIVDRSKVG